MHSKCSSLAHLQLALVLQYFLPEGNYADTAIKVKSDTDTEQHNHTSMQIITMIHPRHQRLRNFMARCCNGLSSLTEHADDGEDGGGHGGEDGGGARVVDVLLCDLQVGHLQQRGQVLRDWHLANNIILIFL